MKNNSKYLISHGDYVKHIDDCVMLYGMIRQLCDQVGQIPQNRGSKALTDMADEFCDKANAIMQHSGIPAVYPLFGDERFLRPLMEKELTVAVPIGEDDEDEDEETEDEVFEDEEDYDEDEDDDEPTLEEIIAMTLSDLADAVQEMNVYLHTITQHMKK